MNIPLSQFAPQRGTVRALMRDERALFCVVYQEPRRLLNGDVTIVKGELYCHARNAGHAAIQCAPQLPPGASIIGTAPVIGVFARDENGDTGSASAAPLKRKNER